MGANQDMVILTAGPNHQIFGLGDKHSSLGVQVKTAESGYFQRSLH